MKHRLFSNHAFGIFSKRIVSIHVAVEAREVLTDSQDTSGP
jgi:hypothetical protein